MEIASGKISTISSLVLSAWIIRWFDLKLEAGNRRSQLSLSWLLEIGGAPALLRAGRRKTPCDETRISGKNHSGLGVRNFQFPASDAGLRASLEAGKLSWSIFHFPASGFQREGWRIGGGRRGEDALASQRVPPEAGSWKLESAHIWCLVMGQTL